MIKWTHIKKARRNGWGTCRAFPLQGTMPLSIVLMHVYIYLSYHGLVENQAEKMATPGIFM